MKGKIIPLLTVFVLLLATFVTHASPTVLRLGHGVAQQNPFHEGSVKFAELVAEKTDGKVDVRIFPAAQLGSEKELLESTMYGTIDFVVSSTAPLSAWIPEIVIFDLPYLFRDRAHFYRTLDSEVCEKMIIEPMEGMGLKILSMWDSGDRHFFTTTRATSEPVKGPDDFRGLKIRVMENPMYIDLVAAMGGQPVAMPFPELYTSLQQGVVDGADNNIINYYTSGCYEVAKHLSLTAHAWLPGLIAVNKQLFDNYPADIQQALVEAAQEAGQYERDYFVNMTQQFLDTLISHGVQVNTNPDQKAFFESVKHLYEKYEDQVGGREVIQAILDL